MDMVKLLTITFQYLDDELWMGIWLQLTPPWTVVYPLSLSKSNAWYLNPPLSVNSSTDTKGHIRVYIREQLYTEKWLAEAKPLTWPSTFHQNVLMVEIRPPNNEKSYRVAGVHLISRRKGMCFLMHSWALAVIMVHLDAHEHFIYI